MYGTVTVVLYYCHLDTVMQKKQMEHPRLYISVKVDADNRLNAQYLSNRFNSDSSRKIENTRLPENVDAENCLTQLNTDEFKKLLIFITRQEKVVATYKQKQKTEQLRIVSESLDALNEFKDEFTVWFETHHIKLNGTL